MNAMPPAERNGWFVSLQRVNASARSAPTQEAASEHASDCAVVLRGPRGDGIPRPDVLAWCARVVAMDGAAREARGVGVRAEALAAVELRLARGAPDDATLAELETGWTAPCGDLVAPGGGLPPGHPARLACERALARARRLRAEADATARDVARLADVLRSGAPDFGSVGAMESYESGCAAWRSQRGRDGADATDIGRFCAEVARRLPELRRNLAEAREREAVALVAALTRRRADAPCAVALYRASEDPRVVAVRLGAVAPCGERMRAVVAQHGAARPWVAALARRVTSEAGALPGGAPDASGLPLRLARGACAGDTRCLPCGAAAPNAYLVRAECRTRQDFVEERVYVPGADIVRREAVAGTNLTREVVTGHERGEQVTRRVPVTVTYATGEVSVEAVPGATLRGPFTAGGSVSRDDDLGPERVLAALGTAISSAARARREEALRLSGDASVEGGARLDAAAEHVALGGADPGARRALALALGLDDDESVWRRLVGGP